MRFLLLAVLLAPFLRAESPHANFIRGFNERGFERGKAIYHSICITCHGSPTHEGTLPTSRPFWKEPFKYGGDPYSLFKTLTHGVGQMPSMAALTPEQRYDAIHYLREAFVQPHNPAAYVKTDDQYLAGLPEDAESLQPTEAMAAAEKGPPYLRMDFGPALFWTFEVAPGNIAYKGIAIRLDDGPGGISKGRAWILYDHDTMRVAAAWTGTNFIDWKGIAFDGSHNSHASIVGEKVFIGAPDKNADLRIRGRDGKPYGPLPRELTQFKGLYYHSNRVVLSYTVGKTNILEMPAWENGVFTRTLNTLTSRIKLSLGGKILSDDAADLTPLTKGGPPRWNPPLATSGNLGKDDGPFAVDELVPPPDAANPWRTWMRFGGFDFFKDGKRAAICTWNGDVWIVSGIDGGLSRLIWKRIASGLFQPLGVKIVDEKIYVTCRDQIARLHDLNGDEEIDFVEAFNSDHQVTEHFHEFAMGLQTDAAGNFYYAKSARHALPALVPHHGTLLKVSRDGSRTEILANGFRAANGVCVNDDGTFFVTDQEGHWTPKNRINWVRPGGFYGNMMGYHDRANDEMEPPLVWITNEMDRSPGEVVRVTSDKWGPLHGALLNLSYGTGRIFIIPHEKVGGTMQGAVCQLPIDDLPTGVMRGRFHPNGALYACGMYAWAGNRQHDGGFYRIRPTGKPSRLPIGFRARKGELHIDFSDPIDSPVTAEAKTWSLKRTANYGSKHFDEKPLPILGVETSPDRRAIRLQIPTLQPTQSMELLLTWRGPDGRPITRKIHGTIHSLSAP